MTVSIIFKHDSAGYFLKYLDKIHVIENKFSPFRIKNAIH